MILGVCDSAEVLKTMRIVKIVINFIRIIVPIILIVTSMMTFTKAITNSDNKKALNIFIKKIVAALAIFLIHTLVGIILKLVDQNKIYYSCFENATKEGIDNAYVEIASKYLSTAKETLNEYDYKNGIRIINDIQDSAKKKQIYDSAASIKEYIDINKAIGELEVNYNKDKYKEIGSRIDKITDAAVQIQLKARYDKIKHYEKTGVVKISDTLRYHVNGYNGLKFYLYSQCEGNWSNIPLRQGTSSFCGIGCGLTTCAVLISAYKPNFTPYNSYGVGDDYHHDQVVEKQTDYAFDCTQYENGQITPEKTIEYLEQGYVASVKVWGKSKGGSSPFTGSQHFMALIDYYEGEIFVGNAYNHNYAHGTWGWYKASEVLTSVKTTVICKPKNM